MVALQSAATLQNDCRSLRVSIMIQEIIPELLPLTSLSKAL